MGTSVREQRPWTLMEAGGPFSLRVAVAELHIEEVILSHNSIHVHASRPNSMKSAMAWGDGGLENCLSVFNRLYNGLCLSLVSICWTPGFMARSLLCFRWSLESGGPKSQGRPDVCLLYSLVMEIQVPAKVVNQICRRGASGHDCEGPSSEWCGCRF